jgi:hypothetical protein
MLSMSGSRGELLRPIWLHEEDCGGHPKVLDAPHRLSHVLANSFHTHSCWLYDDAAGSEGISIVLLSKRVGFPAIRKLTLSRSAHLL